MSLIEQIIQEFQYEAATTRRVLERVPADKLTWTPHPKSMSLGDLALHVASEPAALAHALPAGTIDFQNHVNATGPRSTAEILEVHDDGVRAVTAILRQIGDAGLAQPFNAMMGGSPYFSVPKGAFIRRAVLNHIYHHRGQLSVYLRLIDVPVPAIYGPSADEKPIAAATA